MADLKKILVAYDGSLHSKVALGWGILLGNAGQAELDVVKVFEPISRHYTRGDYDISEKIAEQYAEIEKSDRDMMDDVKTLCKDSCKLKIHVDVLKGHVASALLTYAGQRGTGLIVAGTKGHGVLEEMLVGSVTSALVSLAKVPVLVVKKQRAPLALKNIIVAFDGSEFAKAALDFAVDIAKQSSAKITAVKASEPLDAIELCSMAESGSAERIRAKLADMDEKDRVLMDEAKTAAAHQGVDIGTEILSGENIAEAIIQYAETQAADMIVAGTLGHGLLGELLMGSVTRNLVSLSKCPVLVVKKQ